MLYNQEGTCLDGCASTQVTYVLGDENYCDDFCYEIAAYIDSASPATLFNKEGLCLNECQSDQVSFKNGDEEYCNVACSAIHDIIGLPTPIYNQTMICVEQCNADTPLI